MSQSERKFRPESGRIAPENRENPSGIQAPDTQPVEETIAQLDAGGQKLDVGSAEMELERARAAARTLGLPYDAIQGALDAIAQLRTSGGKGISPGAVLAAVNQAREQAEKATNEELQAIQQAVVGGSLALAGGFGMLSGLFSKYFDGQDIPEQGVDVAALPHLLAVPALPHQSAKQQQAGFGLSS